MEGACLTLSILLLIAPVFGSFKEAICLEPIAIERRSLTHRSLIGRATYRKGRLIPFTNGLDTGGSGILVRTNGGNVVLDLQLLHRLRSCRIRNDTTLRVIVSVLYSVGGHITSWKNHDLGT